MLSTNKTEYSEMFQLELDLHLKLNEEQQNGLTEEILVKHLMQMYKRRGFKIFKEDAATK